MYLHVTSLILMLRGNFFSHLLQRSLPRVFRGVLTWRDQKRAPLYMPAGEASSSDISRIISCWYWCANQRPFFSWNVWWVLFFQCLAHLNYKNCNPEIKLCRTLAIPGNRCVWNTGCWDCFYSCSSLIAYRFSFFQREKSRYFSLSKGTQVW